MSRLAAFLMTFYLFTFVVGTAQAQDATGKILGTVTDSSGAVIVGANVHVANAETQLARDTVTDKAGFYQVLALPIGHYRVSVERDGFKKSVTDAKALEINQALRIDIALEVGAALQVVEVNAQAGSVETVSPTLGQSITSRPLINLPLNGRNMLSLALLQPGVTEPNPNGTGNPGNQSVSGSFSVGGGRIDSVTFVLDGGMNNNLLNNLVVYNPNPDTVAEFRLLTSNYTAEYGRNGGGIVSVVTKSGTNDVHGSAFEFLRNQDLNANTFFNNENNLPRQILKRNQFGFTLGGPVDIPKVLNGKDKFFFFVGYQGQRLIKVETTDLVTTYTPAELNGDFSRSNSGAPDPNVVSFLQANPYFQSDPAKAAQAIIDPSKIDPTSQKYIKAGLIPTSPSGQLISQGGGTNNSDELTWKVDYNPTVNDHISATLGASRNPQLLPFQSAVVSGFPVTYKDLNYFGNVAYTHVFSPRLLNEVRFVAQRNNHLQAIPVTKLPYASDLGIGITPDRPSGPPRLGFDRGLQIGFSPQGPTNEVNNTYIWSENLSWMKGSHNLKFGGTFSPYQNNTVYDYYVNGEFDFYGASGSSFSGNDFADFLFGAPDEYYQFGEAPSNIRSNSWYVFGQDEWRINRRLVLTYGLRYEYSQPKYDAQGRSFSLKQGAQSTVFPNAPTGLLFPGDAGAPTGSNFPDRNDFAPRLGIAFDPTGSGKTSIRAGFGVFYDILKGEDNLQYNGQAPFFGFVDTFFNPVASNPSGPLGYFADPFGSTGAVNPFPSHKPAKNIDFGASGFLPFGGGGVYFVDPHLRTPYTYHYNFSVQRAIKEGFKVEVSYIGSTSHKLTTLVDSNPFVLGTLGRLLNGPGADETSDSCATCNFSYLDTFKNAASSNYNSLQASLQKQITGGGAFGRTYFTLAYTYGHTIDNSSGFRQRNSRVPAYNYDQFRASADFDIRQKIGFSGGWDLPFEHMWASGPKRLTQGWSLYPILSWRTGFPLDLFAGYARRRSRPGPSGAGDNDLIRLDLVGTVTTFDPKRPQDINGTTGNFYFDPNSFARPALSASSLDAVTNPALRTYGSMPRNAFRATGRANFDLAIAKTTPLVGERLKMEIRAEFFNLPNTVQFALPETNFSSSSFGQISNTYDPRIIQFAARMTF